MCRDSLYTTLSLSGFVRYVTVIHYLEDNRLGEGSKNSIPKHTLNQKWWKVGLEGSDPDP